MAKRKQPSHRPQAKHKKSSRSLFDKRERLGRTNPQRKKTTQAPDGHLILAGDDSPTKRYGPHVEGTGVHHHPTPGPADGKWLYGHNWVSLCLVCVHSLWGVIALPLLSRLYVRAKKRPLGT